MVRVKCATGFGNLGSWVQHRVKEIARTRWSRVGAFEAWASSTGTAVEPTSLRSQGQPSENFSKPLRPINHTHTHTPTAKSPSAEPLNESGCYEDTPLEWGGSALSRTERLEGDAGECSEVSQDGDQTKANEHVKQG